VDFVGVLLEQELQLSKLGAQAVLPLKCAVADMDFQVTLVRMLRKLLR
jgi:hypothetical protein